MKNAGNVRKHVENNFYGNINHFYKYEAPVTYNGPVSYKGDEYGSRRQETSLAEVGRQLTDEQIARALENITGKGKALDSHVRTLEEKMQKMKDECDALKQAMLREVFE